MDLKGKKLVTIKILIDQGKDEFGTDIEFKGFENKVPGLLDARLISGVLDVVRNQLMDNLGDVIVKEK